uniref:Retrovirus-related Pol polyprotein from transposon TNT 1-94 n=1 Tax=Tanacetum cinerariifolium TaxID=118510 RepID=A0A6L2JDX2_TANCI|nr:retrovirus-related Pol polyprotein from transposon TNT 1-94 [Tanacetum cinerariifolium]
MTTLADKAILSGADNRPPMLEKDMYDSWKSLMELYMLNRQHGRIILESVENGPLLWPTVKENGVIRPKKYSELSSTEAIQADYDVKTTNIILQGLPPEVYALVSNHKVAKELWERIQLLMQGTSLTKQEREYKLYDEFDKFAYKKGESLRDFYLRFSLPLNDMNIYNMKLEQFQVNTKFLDTLPPEWSKFVTDVKLVRDLHTTNVDQLHAYLGQHEHHANEYASQDQSTPLSITYPSNDFQSSVHHNVYNPSSSIPQVKYAPSVHQQSDFFQPNTGLVVPVFQKGDDPIDAINHMMSFLTAVVTSRGDKILWALVCQDNTHPDKVERLGHNLFSVGQFCDSDLEVAFCQPTCFIRNLDGVDLLIGSRGNNLYTLSLGDMMASSPICLLSKASKTKLWLWHRHHLCSACAMGKSKKKSYKPKSEDTNQEKLYLLHMDLCGPMRVESVNGKKYILVIVDDYSRFTWVKCLRSKDEALDFIIKFLKMIQVRLKVPVRRILTDNGTEFVNQTLREYYEQVGISHETSVARTPQQNGVIERHNRTLIEAARTMLIYTQAPLFLWAEAVATDCYTQNRSIIRLRHGKTPYELLHNKLLNLSFLHVFGALCYPTNDSENLGKLQPKADIGIFIGYAPTKKAFWIYNRRTRRIVETIHVNFDELTAMASKQSSSGPALNEMTPATIHVSLRN